MTNYFYRFSLKEHLVIGLLIASLFSIQIYASPINIHRSKDFRSLIIQSERPELVICVSATNQFIKNNPQIEQFQWVDNTSTTGVLNEVEINQQFVRSITLNAEVLKKNNSFLKFWMPVKVICEQVNEAYPSVKIVETTIQKN
jgi:hypothetical protein